MKTAHNSPWMGRRHPVAVLVTPKGNEDIDSPNFLASINMCRKCGERRKAMETIPACSSPRRIRNVVVVGTPKGNGDLFFAHPTVIDSMPEVQKSVFECWLDQERFEELWQRLCAEMDADEDLLIAYALD